MSIRRTSLAVSIFGVMHAPVNAGIAALAARLDAAVRTGMAIPQLTAEAPLTLVDAYAVQHAGTALRAGRGDDAVGVKLGFTSKSKAEQMGVSDVIIGSLAASMAVPDGGLLDIADRIHPRIEPELAFRLGRALDPMDPDGAPLDAFTHVAPALEIIDSRYQNFRFSLEDVVADNASASAFVLGAWRPLAEVLAKVRLADLSVDVLINGVITASGTTADILGNPLAALATAKRLAGQYGHTLPAGAVLLAGAATPAIVLDAGVSVRSVVSDIGEVSVHTGPFAMEEHRG